MLNVRIFACQITPRRSSSASRLRKIVEVIEMQRDQRFQLLRPSTLGGPSRPMLVVDFDSAPGHNCEVDRSLGILEYPENPPQRCLEVGNGIFCSLLPAMQENRMNASGLQRGQLRRIPANLEVLGHINPDFDSTQRQDVDVVGIVGEMACLDFHG
jgi:hypothetical protein